MKPIFKYVLIFLFIFTYSFAQTKVLYINSYHPEFESAVVQTNTVKEILEPKGIELKFIHMDAKRIKSDELRKLEALKVKKVIEEWKPQLVIASDDVASKYVVKVYYKDKKLPFVFIGVNWSVEQYEYPYSNVTGQIEVALAKELIDELKKYAKGNKVGFLAGDTLTDKKALNHYKNILNMDFDKIKFVTNFKEWKAAYKSLQNEVDVLFFRNNAGIKNWDASDAKVFVENETSIPSGSVSFNVTQYVLINFAKDNYEFAEYGAKTALRILNGTSPSDIPITKNKRAKVSLNMTLAKKLGIVFPIELIDMATLVK